MLHKRMVFALVVMGMMCFLGKGVFGEGMEIGLVKTLEGHSDSVWSVAFSSDARYLASGSQDNTIKLWEVPSGNLLKTLEGHSSYVCSVAFSPDGRYLASGSYDNTIKLWEMPSGDLLKTFEGHGNEVLSVAFSPDGKYLVSGSGDDTIKLWEMPEGRQIKVLEGHTNWVKSVAFSPDGRYLASGSLDDTIKLWKMSTGDLLKTLKGHGSDVNSVAFSSDGKYLVSGGDQDIKLWSMPSGNLLKTLEMYMVSSVVFSSDGKYFAFGKNNGTIDFREMPTGDLLKTLEGHSDSVGSVTFSPDGRYLASGSSDNTIKLWSMPTPPPPFLTVKAKFDDTVVKILSPVVGQIGVVSTEEDCASLYKEGKWCFNRHKTGFHKKGRGLSGSDDTNAWDVNLNSPNWDTDKDKPVYAIAEGTVAKTYADVINASGTAGQILIEHKYNESKWWSGYLHLRDIQVKPGDQVNQDTKLGYISNKGSDNNHLHFVVYAGENKQGNLVSFEAEIQERTNHPKNSLKSTDDFVGKVKIVCKIELCSNIATHEIRKGNIVYPEGYPIGEIISCLSRGDHVEVLKVFFNDTESKYTLKVKTKKGEIGYLTRNSIQLIEPYGDKGAIIFIHLSTPYEYEDDIEGMDNDITKFKNFINKFPNSKFVPEALIEIAGLNLSSVAHSISSENNLARIDEIKKIYKRLFTEFNNPELSQNARKCFEFFSKHEKDFSKSGIIDSKYFELIKNLIKSIPSSLSSATEFEPEPIGGEKLPQEPLQAN